MQYDANKRLISMVDAVGTTAYSYTDFGALLSEDGPWADDTVSYTYTSNRLRSGMTLLQPNATAWTQSYTYDDSSRLTGITSPAGAFSYTYDPVNNLLVRKLSLHNGSYITNAYDALGRMTSTVLKNSQHSTLNSHQYSYDDGSRRTRQTRTGGDYVDYTYDKIGQLKSALGLESGGTTNRWNERFSYSYDAAGNLSNRVQNMLTNVFNVDSLNQLTSAVRTNSSLTVAGTTTASATNVTVADNGNSPVAAIRYAGTNTFTAVAQDNLGRNDTSSVTNYLPTAVTFRYDQNGNLRTNGTRIFEYDDENQLTRVTEPNSWKSEFVYDGKMKMRISKDYEWRNSTWVQTNEVRRVYDGMLAIQERDQFNIAKLTYTRSKDLSGTLDGAGGIGGLLALTESSSLSPLSSYFHSDGNGNVTCLADADQNVVAHYVHDPFGNTVSSAGSKAEVNRYRFSSKERHASVGMAYYGYRWYVPNLQRWLSRDPIDERGGVNLYSFVGNTPLDAIDAYGLVLMGCRNIQGDVSCRACPACKKVCWFFRRSGCQYENPPCDSADKVNRGVIITFGPGGGSVDLVDLQTGATISHLNDHDNTATYCNEFCL